MKDNRTINLAEIPIGGKSGLVWNRLHGEREEICEALLKYAGPFFEERQQLLQTRLRKVDDALDRLMSGANVSNEHESLETTELLLESLEPFDTILVRTQNSDYRILLLDPKTGRALVEGGDYLLEPNDALLKGSAAVGDELKPGMISVGCRLEMWINESVFLTSPVKSMHVKHNSAAETVQDISAALH